MINDKEWFYLRICTYVIYYPKSLPVKELFNLNISGHFLRPLYRAFIFQAEYECAMWVIRLLFCESLKQHESGKNI